MFKLLKIFSLILLALVPVELMATDVKTNAESRLVRLSPAEQRKFDYFYYEATNLKNAGKLDASFDLFSYCYELDSTSAPLLYELGMFNLRMNQAEKGVAYMKNAVKYGSNNFVYRFALAGLYRNMGMYGEASEAYEDLVDQWPDKVDLNYYLAESLTQQGELGKAIEAYNALEESMGMMEMISIQKYKLYQQLEQPEKAFNEVERLANKYPMNARYPLLIGDLYLEKNSPEKALTHFQKAHELDPDDPRYIVSMANYYEHIGDKEKAENEIRNALVNNKLEVDTKIEVLTRYVQGLQQTKEVIEGVLPLFQTLIDQHPEEVDLKMMYASLLEALKKNEEAKFQYQLVTEMEPMNETAWQQLLNQSLKNEDVPEIIKICKKCNELFPDAAEYYFYLGIGYYMEKDMDKAMETYQKGLSIIPQESLVFKSNFYGQIGDLYYEMNKMDEAFKSYDEALKYNENNVAVLNNYSYFLTLMKKDLKKAERMAAQCVKLEPDNATYLDTYAWIFFMQGNYSLAKIYIENALSKDKTNSFELVDHYGDILYMSGDKENAMIQWKKAKEMGKDTDILNQKIAKGIYIEDPNVK